MANTRCPKSRARVQQRFGPNATSVVRITKTHFLCGSQSEVEDQRIGHRLIRAERDAPPQRSRETRRNTGSSRRGRCTPSEGEQKEHQVCTQTTASAWRKAACAPGAEAWVSKPGRVRSGTSVRTTDCPDESERKCLMRKWPSCRRRERTLSPSRQRRQLTIVATSVRS